MQAGPGDRNTADDDRLQVGHRGDGAGAADLKAYVFDQSLFLPWWKLQGNCPSWRTTDHAEFFLQSRVVNLDDHTINLEGQTVALLLKSSESVDHLLGAQGRSCVLQVHAKAEFFQQLQSFNLGCSRDALHAADSVTEDSQRALRGNLCIELAQAAGCSIARVGKGLVSGFFLCPVQGLEVGQVDIDFATYIQDVRVGGFQVVWDVGNRPDVFGDILAHKTIATGAGFYQLALLISQLNSHTVKLHLAGVFKLFGTGQEGFAQAGVKVVKLFGVLGIFKREHRYNMWRRSKLLRERCADLLTRRVRCDQVRKLRFNLL